MYRRELLMMLALILVATAWGQESGNLWERLSNRERRPDIVKESERPREDPGAIPVRVLPTLSDEQLRQQRLEAVKNGYAEAQKLPPYLDRERVRVIRQGSLTDERRAAVHYRYDADGDGELDEVERAVARKAAHERLLDFIKESKNAGQ